MTGRFLMDTHALVFWSMAQHVSEQFVAYFDEQSRQGNVLVSSISFWEAALLAKKGRLEIEDVHGWKNELVEHSNITLIDPTAADMIDSVLLPDHHADPFDRLLIAQASREQARLVTRDRLFARYAVETFWM